MGRSSIPDVTYEIHPGAVLDEAQYISGFECLAQGEDYFGQPVCEYYKAKVSRPRMASKLSGEVCFKELTLVSVPREYKAEWTYRLIVQKELGKQSHYDGVTFARILSHPEIDYSTKWYETTTVALYDCDAPYKLQTKVRTSQGVQSETDRIKQLSETHNITILDNEMSELIELHAEKKKLQGEIQLAFISAFTRGEINASEIKGGPVSGKVIAKLPEDILLRMSEVSEHIEAIEAPFIAAEKAGNIRNRMAVLSETSGVSISSSEIEEAIALNSEKNRILKRTQMEAKRKWQANDGPVSTDQKPFPNAEDGVRLKEIDIRLKAIFAPLH